VLACRPQPQAPHQPSRLLSRPGPAVDRDGPTSLALSLAPGGLVACHGVHRPPGPRTAARPARQQQEEGSSMPEGERQLCRQPHRGPRGPLHPGRDRSGDVPGGGIGPSGAGGVVLHHGRVAGPGRARRAVDLEGQPGGGRGPAPAAELDRPRTTAPGRRWRSWPRSWGRAFAGRRRSPPGRPGASRSSQLDRDRDCDTGGHLSCQFRCAYGESPYAYLMTWRIERAMALLRRCDRSATEVCFAVGCSSLGTFSTASPT
jgi:Helix-turn-helix domain